MKTRYHIIKNFNELKELVKSCKKTGYASVDFETNARGLYMDDFRPTILSVSFQAGSGVSIPLLHFDKSVQFLRKDNQWLKWLLYFGRKVIENPDIVKIAWNWKFDNQIFQKYGIYSRGTVIDGMLAKYLLDETRPNDLKSMVRRFLPEFANYEKYDSFGSISWDKKPLEELCRYGCMDTDFTLRLGIFFESKLIYKNFYNLYRNLLMSASRVLQSAEKFGLPFDKELNGKLIKKYADQIETYETNLRSIRQVRIYEKYTLKKRKEDYINSLYEEIDNLREQEKKEGKNVSRSIKNKEDKISRLMAGEFSTKSEMKLLEPINFKSQKQMVDFLFLSKKGLKLPIIEYTKDPKTKKETTNPSTSENVLLKLKEYDNTGFINNLLDLRGIQTINSTFIVGLGELVQDDGCVHPTFLLHGTTSGRLSSRNPNGQNIPKTMVNPDVKLQFITPKGKLFLTYDYSQAELRILAHLAKEKTMLEWFKTGKDIHLASACKKYHEDYDKIIKIYSDELHPEYKLWKKRRKQAKTINFGIVYEQSAPKLAESLSTPEESVSINEAQEFLEDYFKTFPRIKKYMEKQHSYMESHGYCVSLFGRKRRCPQVYSENYGEYLEALRQSTNMPCQSAASDMALFASIMVYEDVKKGKLPPMIEVDTVHDSVYQFIEPKYITPDTIYKIWDICRNPSTKKYFGFSIDDVDMSMNFTIGRNMAEELPYNPEYDYNKMLLPDFNSDDYYIQYNNVRKKYLDKYGVDIENPGCYPLIYKDIINFNKKRYDEE